MEFLKCFSKFQPLHNNEYIWPLFFSAKAQAFVGRTFKKLQNIKE
jgi:hypothetical protein